MRKDDCSGYRFADVFAGIGGVRIGLEQAGMECAYSVEINEAARETYRLNFGSVPEAADIRSVCGKDMPRVDVLAAGLPCTPFSNAGSRNGFDHPEGMLFFEMLRIMDGMATLPSVVLIENVPRLLSHNSGRSWRIMRRALEGVGYNVLESILSSADYGAATERKRVFIVAFRDDLSTGGFQFPIPTYDPQPLSTALLPDSETDRYVIHRDDINLDDARILGAEKGLDTLRTYRVGQIGTRNNPPQGYRIYTEHGLALTFLARGGGIGAESGAYLVNGRVRRLAPRECANVMGYPDNFNLHPTQGKAYRQIGGSVYVPLVQMVGRQIAAALLKAGYTGLCLPTQVAA